MDKKQLDELMRRLTDQGKLIEAGWISLRITAVDPAAPQVQLDEMKLAFMAGAQHLFSSIMGIMEADPEPTANDMRRMDLIHRELDGWIEDFKKHQAARCNA